MQVATGSVQESRIDSECVCFVEFPEPRFELAAKLQTEKLQL
jgi:hypothetical protein